VKNIKVDRLSPGNSAVAEENGVAIDNIDIVQVGVSEILNKNVSRGSLAGFVRSRQGLAWAGLFNRKHFAGGVTISGQQFSSKWVKRGEGGGPAPE
jgi:hypothetical protein